MTDGAFPHEKLDAYRAAVEFVGVSAAVIAGFPRGHGYLADQLARSASSVVLNIAEGAGRFAKRDKTHFYRIALGSAGEAAAVLDVASSLGVIARHDAERGRTLLGRIGAMLTALCVRHSRTGSDPGPEPGSDPATR